MPREHSGTVTCLVCGEKSEFIAWDSVNTVLNPELKDKVFNNELFDFHCFKGGAFPHVDYSLLYHQMEDHIMIKYANDEESYQKAYDFFSGKFLEKDSKMMLEENHYIFRIVKSINDCANGSFNSYELYGWEGNQW